MAPSWAAGRGRDRRDELRGALVGRRQGRGAGYAGAGRERLARGREVVGGRLVGVVARRGLLRCTGPGSLVGRHLALLRGQRLGLGLWGGLADGRQVVRGRFVGAVTRRGLRLGLGRYTAGRLRYAAGRLGRAPGLGLRLRPVLVLALLGLALLPAGTPRGAPRLTAGRLAVGRGAGTLAVCRVGRRAGRALLRRAAVTALLRGAVSGLRTALSTGLSRQQGFPAVGGQHDAFARFARRGLLALSTLRHRDSY